ncbi:MAG: ribosomal-protein-alanine N-acetyltransferase [Ruminococcaceae bacterium]|nr:ribosomal-protein-alanine N-acetyltransferase [Oscillospiraceae bacterium]
MEYIILTATMNDVADIKKIEDACFSVPWSEKSIEESLANPCSHFYIARVNNEAAGYIGIQIFSGEGYVTNVATLPEFRKQGIAGALVERALENEMEFLTLEVRKSNNPAINLYSKFGFEAVGVRPKFYREPTEDAILMTKFL